MGARDKDEAQGFLSRWSQRKRTLEQEGEQPPAAQTRTDEPDRAADDPAVVADERTGRPQRETQEIDPAQLPDIDSLDDESDFAVFMKQGVPEALRRRALRKLWRLNPVFGHLDGLNDYDLDYTNAATVVANLKSIYQVGKGMVLPEEEEEARKTAALREGEAADAEASAGEAPTARAGDESAGEATESGVTESVATQPDSPSATPRSRARNPGDAIVSGATTRRNAAPRSAARSALRRRWGDSDA